MTEIYVYNKALELVGITDEVTEFMFTKRFYDGSIFTVRLPMTEKNTRLFQPQAIIEAGRFSGIITDISIKNNVISASGKSFAGMLSSRIAGEGEKNDTLMTIIDKNACQAAGALRAFERTYADKSVDCDVPDEVSRTQNLSEFIRIVSSENDFGVFSEIDHSRDMIRIYGRKAVDRSINQQEHECVVFSEMYGNVSSMSYTYTEGGAVNGALIYADAGIYDNGDVSGNIAEFHKYCGNVSGYARHEGVFEISPCITFHLNALGELKAILDDVKTAESADAEYLNRKIDVTDCVSAAVVIDEKYTALFDVGDIVTVYGNSLGIFTDYRITEITESYTVGGAKINVTFGEPIKSLRRLIK